MEKVILITTREFERYIASDRDFKEITDYKTPTTVQGGPLGRGKTVSNDTYLGLFFDKEWGNNEAQFFTIKDWSLYETETIALNISEILTTERKQGGKFKFGIWKKELTASECIFITDECPPNYEEKRFTYLNAIVAEIMYNLKKNIDGIEWTIISHDGDWGLKKNSMIIKQRGIENFVEEIIDQVPSTLSDNPNLKSIVETENSEIIVFQHSPTSDWYLFVQMISELKKTEDKNNFVKIAQKQKKDVSLLLKKEKFDPNDFVKLKIDPKYPFLSLD